MLSLLILSDKPTAVEELEGEPFTHRGGLLIKKIIGDSTLLNRLDSVGYGYTDRMPIIKQDLKVIVPLGLDATSFILKRKIKNLQDVIGLFIDCPCSHLVKVCPFYNINTILRSNLYNESVRFFSRIEYYL